MNCHDFLKAQIAADGPMQTDRFMQICLSHPDFGYYGSRDPFGRGGDFTTAPEISQLFGEMMAGFMAYANQPTNQQPTTTNNNTHHLWRYLNEQTTTYCCS